MWSGRGDEEGLINCSLWFWGRLGEEAGACWGGRKGHPANGECGGQPWMPMQSSGIRLVLEMAGGLGALSAWGNEVGEHVLVTQSQPHLPPVS